MDDQKAAQLSATVTVIVHLCEACAEGRGLEIDLGAKVVTATCEDCGNKQPCIVAMRVEK